jgi:Transcriptional regulator, AbiEi antitoxin
MMLTRRVPEELTVALKSGNGLLNSASCRAIGLSYGQIERLVRQGTLVCLARGVYTDAQAMAALGPWDNFALRSRAFVMASPAGAAASDWSAVAIHRLPAIPKPPQVPSVIRVGSRTSGSNRTCNGRTRFASVQDRWFSTMDELAVVTPAFAAVDLARRCEPIAALALADAVARRDVTNKNMLLAWQDMRKWPSINRARWVIDNADADAESALESAGRFAFISGGLALPKSNVWVGDVGPRYRLDHFWAEQRLAAEGDGLKKYHLDDDPGRALGLEKDREWWLHSKGIRVIRYTWKLAVGSPDLLVDRCRTMLSEPALPLNGSLRTWSSREGSALLGLAR